MLVADTAMQSLLKLLEPPIQQLGYALVRLQQTGGRGSMVLQVMVERPTGTLTIDDCVTITRTLSPILEAADPISAAYRLEVSSPGIDRPLTRAEDFSRFAGFEARIETDAAINGQRNFVWQLAGLSGNQVLLQPAPVAKPAPKKGAKVSAKPKAAKETPPPAPTPIPLASIVRAKLLLTDDLIKASQSWQQA